MKKATWMIAAALMAAGCGSNAPKERHADGQTDLAEQNRLLVRMALAENLYNATAVERALYPKDFFPGTSKLNELGTQRVRMLLDSCSGSRTSVTVVHGEEEDEVYDARIAAIRQQLADSGAEQVAVVKGGRVGGGGVESDRAVLTYKRMLTDYTAKPGASAQPDASTAPQGMTDTNSKGQ